MWRRTAKFSRLECLFSRERAFLAHLEQSRVGWQASERYRDPALARRVSPLQGGQSDVRRALNLCPPSQNSLILSRRSNHPRLGPAPKLILAYRSAKLVSQHREFPSRRMDCRKPKSVTSFLCLIRSCLSQDTEIKAPCVREQINQFGPPNNGNSNTSAYLWVLCFHVLR